MRHAIKRRFNPLAVVLFSLVVGGCSTPLDKSSPSFPSVVSNTQSLEHRVNIKDSTTKLVTIDLSITADYAHLSLLSGATLLIDNLDIPKSGQHKLTYLVDFPALGEQTLTFRSRGGKINLMSFDVKNIDNVNLPQFKDHSAAIGLKTDETFKYGGPSVGDVNNDGYLDFVTNNHNYVPTQLFTNHQGKSVSELRLFKHSLDFHGSALGDYDQDGDLDIMVAKGGANGTNPTSYQLLRNDNGKFKQVSNAAGINTPARGRSPRWVDFDLDGDLDLALFNAKTPMKKGAIQLFYRNQGDGTFEPVSVPGLETFNAERVLITDFNRDGKDDVVLYSPFSIWQGHGDFTFTNVTQQLVPKSVVNAKQVTAVTDVDVNNDGLIDLYLSRGLPHFQLSNKSIDFNPLTQQLDVRDQGKKGRTLITFDAGEQINLSHVDLVFRQYRGNYPIFLGKDKKRLVIKASGFQPNQIPEEMKTAPAQLTIQAEQAQGWADSQAENGFYLGYLGNGKWQMEWVRHKTIYWNVSFKLSGLTNVAYDWPANNRNVQDILLINQGDRFVNASQQWQIPKGGNHWGVTHGDFNNDGWTDLFVHRYGFLDDRVTDLMLLNMQGKRFAITTMHGAHDVNDPGHGDMGQAFDFDLDGQIDLLNGSEEEGHWYLYKNVSSNQGNNLLIHIGYSAKDGIDPLGAEVVVSLDDGTQLVRRVGSAGEVFSQGVINTLQFGIAKQSKVKKVSVVWRNGETKQLIKPKLNQRYSTDANNFNNG
ncbi:hypothetical protein C2869_04325 [Saccharobesus litoralis]|uniref:ASPIC/UnbV domain-containing protein n=1 Tax=Saccharobesus litoralis TaxID=2172099 RepID=A0A2S0VNG2_9ALTE|nr:CRTAC1 family protein [Saccharobesus litoralis]AWB65712.1 hypothetical protein C2869_04325 [Saccharobesus litoralis]